VTLQAMARGRPVVLTRTRGLWRPAALHDGENVVLVPPADAADLARAVDALLADGSRAARIGAAARASISRDATVEAYAERLLEVCRLALARP
jgi:glycosyltransferase involved in cell wall biosynthesis